MKSVDFAQRHFLILNALVVTFVILSFFFTRKGPRSPVKLRLKGEEGEKSVPTSVHASSHPKGRPSGWENYRPRTGSKSAQVVSEEKNLNAMFNWNGHSWDAYEVLGLPAGSSREAAHLAFDKLSAQCDAESLPFLRAAYEAILKS